MAMKIREFFVVFSALLASAAGQDAYCEELRLSYEVQISEVQDPPDDTEQYPDFSIPWIEIVCLERLCNLLGGVMETKFRIPPYSQEPILTFSCACGNHDLTWNDENASMVVHLCRDGEWRTCQTEEECDVLEDASNYYGQCLRYSLPIP